MSDDVVHVDRDLRDKPCLSWREAWRASSHGGGTLSMFYWARDAVSHGGWRAMAIPALGCAVMASIFVAGAFGAALLAAQANTTRSRGLLVILASVGLSQLLTLVQSQRPVKRLFVAAAERVSSPPYGWGSVFISVPPKSAPVAKLMLETAFPFVEVTYYRGGKDAALRAHVGPFGEDESPDLEALANATLKDLAHTVQSVSWWRVAR